MTPRFTPIFASSTESARAYSAFGKVAVNWGPLEVTFEDMLLHLRVRQGLNDVGNFPGSYSAVCNELAKRLSQEPMFTHLVLPLTAAITERKALHEVRVAVVHGICQGSDIDGRLMFGKSKRREGWAYRSRVFTVEALEEAADRMLAIVDELEPIRAELQARFLREPDGSLRALNRR